MGDMEQKIGICGLCGGSCPICAQVKDNRILSVQKLEGHPYLEGKLCVRGAALKQFVHHKDRIEHPMKRVGPKGSGQYEPITWEQAVSEIAARLRQTKEESGAKATVFYCGHPKWYRKVLAELAAAYGSPNFCTESSTCNSAVAMAWRLVCGGQLKPDAAHSKTHVVWSNNPGGGDGNNTAITSLRKKGVKLIVVDPRVTAAANVADLHLQLYPGTDGALALSIANVILREGLEDREYIEAYTHGFEEFKAYAENFPPERAAEITGVPAEKIVEAAHMMAGGKVSLRNSSCALAHCVNGVQNLRAVLMLLALTGSLGREGGNLSGNGAPTASLDTFHHLLAQRPDIEDDISGGEFPAWNDLINNEAQCIHLSDVILREDPYPIRNLIMVGANVNMFPRSDRIREALRKVEYSVVAELFWNEACETADLVLPSCTAPERDHVVIGKNNHLMLVNRLIDPGDKLPDVEFLLRLAHALDLHGPFLDQQDYHAYLNYVMRKTGVTLDELIEHPEGVDARTVKKVKPFDCATDFKTPTGKIEFVSTLMTRYAGCLRHDPLPIYTDWRSVVGDRTDYPFILVSGARKAHFFHSRTYRMSWISGLEPHTVVNLCPADAERLGVEDGEKVKLTTPVGSMDYIVAIDHGVKPGVVHVYHDDGDQNINLLIDDHYYDPVSGFPGFRSYICRLEKTADLRE